MGSRIKAYVTIKLKENILETKLNGCRIIPTKDNKNYILVLPTKKAQTEEEKNIYNLNIQGYYNSTELPTPLFFQVQKMVIDEYKRMQNRGRQ